MNPTQESVSLPELSQTSKAGKSRLWFLQFRLRELLLLMIAVSAVTMVVVQNMRSYWLSPVYQRASTERLDALIQSIAAKHGLTLPRSGGAGAGSYLRLTTESTSRDYAIPETMRESIKSDFCQAIRNSIAESGGMEQGIGTAGDSVTFNYVCGKRAGMIYVAFFPVSPEIWRVNCLFAETMH